MATEWIEKLADGIKEKNHEAAEEFGRAQHYAGVIAEVGKEYFVALTFSLQENVAALRRTLQGDAASSEMSLKTVKAGEVTIERERFPWVDARLTHKEDTIALDYAKRPGAKGTGMEGDAALGRKTRSFAFHVAQDDTVYVQDAFADSPRTYAKPEELAREITETLFGA
jgi:hypothetical protein